MDLNKFDEYIKFLAENSCEYGINTQWHHIIPRSIAPQLIHTSWNIAKLSIPCHILAHRMLAEGVFADDPINNYKCAFIYNLMCHRYRVSDEEIRYARILLDDALRLRKEYLSQCEIG